MHKEEIQGLLDRFGYSVMVRRNIGDTGRVHMIHAGNIFGRLVEYTIDEPKDLINAILVYADEELQRIENAIDLENWLNG